jgi:hypothetical protein
MAVDEQELRRLANKKASRPMLGEGIPEPHDGNDGDFRVNNTPTGVKLYAKFAGQWFGFSPDSGTSSTGKTYCLHGGVVSNSTTLDYLYFHDSGSRYNASDDYADHMTFTAPWNAQIRSIVFRPAWDTSLFSGTLSSGKTDGELSIWKLPDGTATSDGNRIGVAEFTLENSTVYKTISLNYNGARFAAGDALKLGLQIDSTGGAPIYISWSALIEID